MSRPSSTAPSPARAKRCCNSISSARTSGSAATIEAASPISRVAQPGVVEIRERQAARDSDRRLHVVKPQSFVKQRAGGGAIEQARVEMRQVEMRRETARQRALARSGWSVDGYNQRAHANFAPSFSIRARNDGKLVAIMLWSSTVTDSSRGEAHDEKAHGDAVIEMRFDAAPRP